MPDDSPGEAGADDRQLTKEVAIEKLAKRLYWKMEQLDPGLGESESRSWNQLDEGERRFCRSLVSDLILHTDWIVVAQDLP